jgi:hypothetical protein
MYTTTTITLDALFANSEGKKHHFRMKGFDPNKPAEKVKAALTKLAKLDIFEKDGIGLYKELLEAKMIQRTDTVLFKEERKKGTKNRGKRFLCATLRNGSGNGVYDGRTSRCFGNARTPARLDDH